MNEKWLYMPEKFSGLWRNRPQETKRPIIHQSHFSLERTIFHTWHTCTWHYCINNSPQFSSDSFRLFTTEHDFVHVTSSSKYPRANGEVERTVRMVKALHRKNADPYPALVSCPVSCSWGTACELKFLSCQLSLNLMCKILTSKECSWERKNTGQNNRFIMINDTKPVPSLC